MTATPLKDMIRTVNGRVNRKLQDFTDVELYSSNDFWRRALANRECADSTMMKIHMLLDEGFPSGKIKLAMCLDQLGSYRAVIVVEVEDGPWAMDNQHFFITRPDSLGYLFEKSAKFGCAWEPVRAALSSQN